MSGLVGMRTRVLNDQRVRFLIIGAVNSMVGYGFFVLVQWLFGAYISYFGSLIAAHLLASILAFLLYRAYVFRVRGAALVDFLRFQVVYLVPLTANAIALPVLVSLLHWNVYIAQATIVAVSAIVSYFGHKFFSFRRAKVLSEKES